MELPHTRSFRERIQATIADHPNDPVQAAIAVCVLLDWDLSLSGNGWFDNDAVMEQELAKDAAPPH